MESSDRTRIVIYYSIWATICAAAAGIVVTLIHTWFFSYNPGKSALMETLFGGLVTALAIAAGQGAVALVTGSLLAQLGRTLQYTVLLGSQHAEGVPADDGAAARVATLVARPVGGDVDPAEAEAGHHQHQRADHRARGAAGEGPDR